MTRSILLCLALAAPAAGQAVVEAGLGAARAATTTAPAAGIGKSIKGLSDTFEKSLKPKQATATTTDYTPPPSTVATAAPAPPTQTWEDPAVIETGLAYDDLLHRFGPPLMSISNTTGKSLTYRGKEGYYQIETKDAKVSTVTRPE